MRGVLALVAVAACSGGAPPAGPEPVDGRELDAATDAGIDAMTCPLPFHPEPPLEPPAEPPPPGGIYPGQWTCQTGVCAGLDPDDFMRAGGIEVLEDGTITWYREYPRTDPMLTVRSVRSGSCWRVDRNTDTAHCLGAFTLCRGGDLAPRAEVQRYDFAAGAWYRWRWPN